MKNPEIYGKEYDNNAMGWEYLESFVKWCTNRDAKVVFMPSTLMRNKTYFKDDKEKWFYENIANEVRKKGWRFVGEPYEYMYDKANYFNTNFHLINRAREMRTLRMVRDLGELRGKR